MELGFLCIIELQGKDGSGVLSNRGSEAADV